MSAANGQISSKRVIGVLAWLTILGTYAYCAYSEHSTPEMSDTIIIAASTLLGVDSVTSAFKKPNKED